MELNQGSMAELSPHVLWLSKWSPSNSGTMTTWVCVRDANNNSHHTPTESETVITIFTDKRKLN